MMGRWGLDVMRSFEQANVARKEGSRLTEIHPADVDVDTNVRTAQSDVAQ